MDEDNLKPTDGILGAMRNAAEISEQLGKTYAAIPSPASERLTKSYSALARAAAGAIGPPPEAISAPTIVSAEAITAREVGRLNAQTATLVEAVHSLVEVTVVFHESTRRSNQHLIRLTVAILAVALVSIALSACVALWA